MKKLLRTDISKIIAVILFGLIPSTWFAVMGADAVAVGIIFILATLLMAGIISECDN
jgi:hypothetical protein